MLNDRTHEVGCDSCCVSTADDEIHAIASAWLVDARTVPRRHICPVCLAGTGALTSQRPRFERSGARIRSTPCHSADLGLASSRIAN